MVQFTSTDFNNAASESGVVHENTNHTAYNNASTIRQGYGTVSPLYSSSLVAYWLFQETSGTTGYDFSGNGYNATSNNGAGPSGTGTTPAPLGVTSWSLDGVDDYISLPSGLVSPTSSFSVSFWARPATVSSHMRFIVLRADVRFIVDVDESTSGSIDVWTNGTWHQGVGTISANQWTRVMVTYDSSNDNWAVYVNGSQTSTFSNALSSGSHSNMIGKQYNNSYHYHGAISDVTIYNRVITPSEEQALYNVVNTQGTLTTQSKAV